MWHASNAGARGRGALSGMSSSNSSSAAEIVFDHVTKRYANAPKPAIDDLSLTLKLAVSAGNGPADSADKTPPLP